MEHVGHACAVVIGGNSGLGFGVVQALIARNAKVTALARNV
jgi:NAD(P)-dependent dehydrogenase (short-subunit alcohol dehydrogenase family)